MRGFAVELRNHVRRATLGACIAVMGALGLGGCPQQGSAVQVVAGSTGDPTQLAAEASVTVFAPVSNLSIAGGTPVEVAWRAVATTRIAVINVIVDTDLVPDNGNELTAESNLALTETSALVDTTSLAAGEYFIGVIVLELGEIAAFDYAPARITINQRPVLFFTSPRDNFVFDRSSAQNPRFDVAWTLSDPDSVVTVKMLLDPDTTPNGNEILLRESTSQTGDSFSFNLPTSSFNPGTYRFLALVTDSVDVFPFYSPASIRIRNRLAGLIDLRDLDLPTSTVAGAIFEGFNPRDNAGSFVSRVSDIDGDGFGDFTIVAQFGKPQYVVNLERTGIGESYLIYGRADRFSGRINLNSTGTLFRGEIYGGPHEVTDPIRPSRGISSFTVLSDWDGDGVREFAFGIPFTDSAALSSVSNFCDLDPRGYFRSGGVVVASSSSLRPDLGFPGRNVFNLAEFGMIAHVGPTDAPCPEGFYGPKASIDVEPPEFSDGWTLFHRHRFVIGGIPNEGSVRFGCRFSSNDFGDQFGESVSTGDFDSIIISAPNRDPFASVNAVYRSGFGLDGNGGGIDGAGVVSIFYNDVKDGFYPWTSVNAPPANAAQGYPGMRGKDADLIPHGGPFHYVIDDLRLFPTAVGLQQGAPGFWVDPDDAEQPCEVVSDGHIDTPANSVRLWTSAPGGHLGNARGAGDFNADGLLDYLVGAPFANQGAGACFVILGRVRDLVVSGELQVEELGLPSNSPDESRARIFDGIRVVGGPGERLGQAQDDAGDFNNDGVADVIIGSPLVNNRAGGAAIFFGSRDVINLTTDEIPFDELPARGLGVVFVGESEGDLAGARVAGVRDIDGDGNDDVLIAAPDRSVRVDLDGDGVLDVDRTHCGVVYLIYGSPNLRGTISLSRVGTPDLPGATFIGRNSGDFLGAGLGEQGDRSYGIATAGDVDGDGRGDLLIGSVSAAPRDRVRAGEAYLIYGTGD